MPGNGYTYPSISPLRCETEWILSAELDLDFVFMITFVHHWF